jgi:hypothetical protein
MDFLQYRVFFPVLDRDCEIYYDMYYHYLKMPRSRYTRINITLLYVHYFIKNHQLPFNIFLQYYMGFLKLSSPEILHASCPLVCKCGDPLANG